MNVNFYFWTSFTEILLPTRITSCINRIIIFCFRDYILFWVRWLHTIQVNRIIAGYPAGCRAGSRARYPAGCRAGSPAGYRPGSPAGCTAGYIPCSMSTRRHIYLHVLIYVKYTCIWVEERIVVFILSPGTLSTIIICVSVPTHLSRHIYRSRTHLKVYIYSNSFIVVNTHDRFILIYSF